MVAAALLLFVAGTQYCLLGAFAPLSPLAARLGCGMLDPATALASPVSHCGAAAAPQAPAHPCCAPGASGATKSPAAPKRGPMPCCQAFAPVVDAAGPGIGHALETTVLLVAVLDAAEPARAAHPAFTLERDTGPPAALARAPVSGRAPPILL